MRFHPLGVVYRCDNYAQTPTPLVLADRVRIFVASRDSDGKSFVRFVDLDLDDPTKVIDESGEVLGRGKPGAFDQDGAMPSFAFVQHGAVLLYYSGWTACLTTGYHNATGVAGYDKSLNIFKRIHEGPILDRTPTEPFLAVTPCLTGEFPLREMFYISGLRWEVVDGKREPIYAIHRAVQDFDALEDHVWMRDGILSVEQRSPDECFSRPWVVGRGRKERLLYSYRSSKDYRDGPGAYRIGMAKRFSSGYDWKRLDNDIHLPRTPGFDDTMQCYAALFTVKDKTFMVYNGNTFGKHGFALAVME